MCWGLENLGWVPGCGGEERELPPWFSWAIFCCHFSVCYVGVEKRACKCVRERMDTKGRRKSKIECEDPFGRTCPTNVDLM